MCIICVSTPVPQSMNSHTSAGVCICAANRDHEALNPLELKLQVFVGYLPHYMGPGFKALGFMVVLQVL